MPPNRQYSEELRLRAEIGRSQQNETEARITDEAIVIGMAVIARTSMQPYNHLQKPIQTMERSVAEILDKYCIKFNAMVPQLDVDESNIQEIIFNIADSMFDDKQVNWGRIVALYAFGTKLAQHCQEKGQQQLLPSIATSIGEYVGLKLNQWIQQHGSWEALCRQFPEKNAEETAIWKSLLATAAVGIGALATYSFISVR